MVMLYALPLALFAGIAGIPRNEVLSQRELALALFVGMIGAYALVVLVSYGLLKRNLSIASLRALAIAGPAVPFVGAPVLGHLFGASSVMPISIASLLMNLIQVPATLMALSKATRNQSTSTVPKPSLSGQIVKALREPVVWAPVAALALVLLNVQFPKAIRNALMLLGGATGGVALFASGIVLFSRRVVLNRTVAVSVLARNIVVPAAMLALVRLPGWPADVSREAVLTLAIPTSSIPVILAVQYQTAEQEMASTLFFSTVLSVLTMAGFIWLTA
jgi:malonate transporter and related proteins